MTIEADYFGYREEGCPFFYSGGDEGYWADAWEEARGQTRPDLMTYIMERGNMTQPKEDEAKEKLEFALYALRLEGYIRQLESELFLINEEGDNHE